MWNLPAKLGENFLGFLKVFCFRLCCLQARLCETNELIDCSAKIWYGRRVFAKKSPTLGERPWIMGVVRLYRKMSGGMSVGCPKLLNSSSNCCCGEIPRSTFPERQVPDTHEARTGVGNGISPNGSGAWAELPRSLQTLFPGLEIQQTSEGFQLKYPKMLQVIDEQQLQSLQNFINDIQPRRLVFDCPVRLDTADLNGRGQVYFAGEVVVGVQANIAGCTFSGQETMISGNVQNCRFDGEQVRVTAQAKVISSCFVGDELNVAGKGKITACSLESQRIEIAGVVEDSSIGTDNSVVCVSFDAEVRKCTILSGQTSVFGEPQILECKCYGEMVVSGAAVVSVVLFGGKARLVADGKGEAGPLLGARVRILNLGTVVLEYTFGTPTQPTRVKLVLWSDGVVPSETVGELDRLVQQGLVQRRVVDRNGQVLTTSAEYQ